VTHVNLLSIGIDSQPQQIRLDPADGRLLLRLEVGVHLNLDKTSPATCRALAAAFENAALLKDLELRGLPEVVS
jgi:hypothetical protein